jgi:KDO2-lipid IV(A) lauroyltransferase
VITLGVMDLRQAELDAYVDKGRNSSMERRGQNFRKRLLRAILPAIRILPLPVAARFLSGFGRLEYRLYPRLRRSFFDAVARGRLILGGAWDVSSVSRELAGNHILWRTRDLLLDGVSPERAREMVTVTGREHLESAIGQARGCILLANHFGAHMLPAHWLVRENFPLRLFMERPRHISRYMRKQFHSEGPLSQDKLFISRQSDASDSASSILRAARTIKAGMLLYIAGDVRWSGRLTETARFLGQTLRFSSTWVVLAAMTEAPVVIEFCRMEPDGHYHIEFLPAFFVPKDAAIENRGAQWVQRFIDALEDQIRRYPASSNDYFFWREAGSQVA